MLEWKVLLLPLAGWLLVAEDVLECGEELPLGDLAIMIGIDGLERVPDVLDGDFVIEVHRSVKVLEEKEELLLVKGEGVVGVVLAEDIVHIELKLLVGDVHLRNCCLFIIHSLSLLILMIPHFSPIIHSYNYLTPPQSLLRTSI